MKPRKTKKLLESSYYTGVNSGQSAPETISAYEFSRDSVPTLNKIASLKSQGKDQETPQWLPFPFQDAVRQLADVYLGAQAMRNKAREATKLPFFKGREADLEDFRRRLNGIMVECNKLATSLHKFTLAPKR